MHFHVQETCVSPICKMVTFTVLWVLWLSTSLRKPLILPDTEQELQLHCADEDAVICPLPKAILRQERERLLAPGQLTGKATAACRAPAC